MCDDGGNRSAFLCNKAGGALNMGEDIGFDENVARNSGARSCNDEIDISNSGDLSKYLINHEPGLEVDITFYRDGVLRTIELILASSQ